MIKNTFKNKTILTVDNLKRCFHPRGNAAWYNLHCNNQYALVHENT